MTPQADRKLRAALAANARWARTPDRAGATRKARDAWHQMFEDQVDPDRRLAPEVRARLAANAKRAHMARIRRNRTR